MAQSKMEGRFALLERVQSLASKVGQKILVVGIDGPTASGKTMLADWLSTELSKRGLRTFNYRLDWCLKERSARLQDLSHLKKSGRPFSFEGELHMDLSRAKNFLLDIKALNEKVSEGLAFSQDPVVLEGLYSREHGGACTGNQVFQPSPGMIVFIEGHYTLRNELDTLIDLNVLLLCDVDELLKRKIARVKDYRGAEEAEDYFWRIDLPSFQQHVARFGWNADVLIDNTDYENPVVQGPRYIAAWMEGSKQNSQDEPLSSTEIDDILFSDSLQVPEALREHTRKAIEMLHRWDRSVGGYLRTSLSDITVDLEELANGFVLKLNESRLDKNYSFRLTHTDAFHNVYYRKLPLNLGMAICDSSGAFHIAFIAIIRQSNLRIQVYWAGGHRELCFERKLGEITTSQVSVLKNLSTETPIKKPLKDPLQVMLPTHFTVPAFLDGLTYSPVYTGREQENISASEALCSLMNEGGVGIFRFSLFSEIRFFSFCMDSCGIAHMQAGNYLICLRHPSPSLRERFKPFSKAWVSPEKRKALFTKAEDEIDRLARLDITDAKTFIQTRCPSFQMRDGYLFSHFLYADHSSMEQGLGELKQMLACDNRFLRKKATQFLLEYFPGFTLPTQKLWSDLPEGAESDITLESFTHLGPSILAEIYLWLALRGTPAAVLGANLYDIRPQSADARAFLRSAALAKKPIVLQTSLNASGQKEEVDGHISHGYLAPQNGGADFANACQRAARDLLISQGITPPLYSLGLDHVSADYDRPKGRAKRFLNSLLADRQITHVVLDGSPLFKASDRSDDELKKAYTRVAEFAADLIEDPRKMYLVDLELCAGEFNYVGNDKEAYVPDAQEMRLFVRTFQERVLARETDAVLGRPMLLAGNLGTTHHGADVTPPPVETSQAWVEALKSENIVSAVLHGTSKSHRDVLSRSTVGCHKVNVAGDFLETLVRNLPERIYSKIRGSGKEPKKMMPLIRSDMDAMSELETQRLEGALEDHAQDLMESIHAPTLTQMDTNYFRYISYVYSAQQIQAILDGVRSRLLKTTHSGVTKLADSSMGCAFAASMIEVPLEETKGPLCEMLWDEGIRYFHVDAGDGKFISRSFSGLEKIKYLKERFPNATIHTHLMVANPHHSRGREKSVIQLYADAGSDAIAIHPRALSQPHEVDTALNLIRTLGCRPGIVIETSDSINEQLKNLIERTQLDWAIVMGVPIGYGGQLFQFATINRIAALNQFANQLERDFLIECDGGLNMETLRYCKNAGAQVFSGWSIIKGTSHPEISSRLREVRQALGSETWKDRG